MSRAERRFYRTITLGLLMLGVLIWAAIERFDVPRREMRDLLIATVWVVLGTIGLAAFAAALWMGLRRIFHKD